MNPTQTVSVVDQIFRAIENDELVLPAMPGSATTIQKMLDDINVSASKIIAAIASDPVIAAHLIKTANGAAHGDKPKVDSVMAAVSRLGFRFLHDLTATIGTSWPSHAEHPVITKHLAEFWEHSREVAAISHVLAGNHGHLDPEKALLAGMVHDIGTVPICLHAEKMVPELDGASLGSVVREFSAKIGEKLLHASRFPQELIEVAVAHEDLHRETGNSSASYADVVTVANMLSVKTPHMVNWDNIAAVKRLCLSPDACLRFFDQRGKEVHVARTMLSLHK